MNMRFLMSAVCALSLAAAISGCATSEEDFIIQKGVNDDRVELVGNSDFGLKNLEVLSKTDDNGLLTVDVTVEVSRTTFWYWVFYGDPLLKLAYRFDWIDDQGQTAAMPWQYSSVLPGNILRFHGIAPAEKYTSFKFFVRFYEKGETLPGPSKAENEAAPVKKDKATAEKSAAPVKSAAPAAGQKAEQAPAKTEMKKMETAVKTDVKKAEAKAEAEVRKAETAVKADVKKVEAKAEAEVKKAETAVKADVKKAEAKAEAEVRKAETAVKADVKKVEAKAETEVRKAETAVKADVKKAEAKTEAEVRKIEKELKKEEGKLTESFY